MHSEAGVVTKAMRAGASGFVLKHSAGDELTDALEAVLNGRTYLTPAVTKDVLDAFDNARKTTPEVELTARQSEVLRLIVEGRRMKEIGAILDLSTRTVESHKYEMMLVLGVQSTAELIRLAVKRGLA
jgi:DNA-binding NarL/FixJ family response regulator